MTLEEAIKHAEEVADLCEYEAGKYDMSDSYESYVACQEGKCAEEHRQLAEWLKDYKQLKEQKSCEDAMNRILKKMWNCRGKHTVSIDKVKMEQILRDELPSVVPDAINNSKVKRYVSIDVIKEALCQHDEDYDYPCIAPHYLEDELDHLAIDEPPSDMVSREVIEDIKAEITKAKQYKGKSGNPYINSHDTGLDRYYDLGLEKALKIIEQHISGKEERRNDSYYI